MLKVMIVLIGLGNGILTFAGHETGNGGNFKDFFSDSAWFVEDRPIYYCITRSNKFVVGKDEIERVVESSLEKWNNYYEHMNSKVFNIFENKYKIQTHFIYQEQCTTKVDLTFYFGGNPIPIRPILDLYKRNVALAYPLETNKTHTWSKGFIFIRDSNVKGEIPASEVDKANELEETDEKDEDQAVLVADWSYRHNLDAIILHELGHLFGVGHAPQTIMSENIAMELILTTYDLEYPEKYKTKINHLYSLEPNKLINNLHFKSNNVTSILDFSNDKKYVLKQFDSNNSNHYLYEFIPSEKININNSMMSVLDDVEIFKIMAKSFDGKTLIFSTLANFERFIIDGIIKFEGEEFPGIYLKNFGNNNHQMKIFRNHQWEYLFQYSN